MDTGAALVPHLLEGQKHYFYNFINRVNQPYLMLSFLRPDGIVFGVKDLNVPVITTWLQRQ